MSRISGADGADGAASARADAERRAEQARRAEEARKRAEAARQKAEAAARAAVDAKKSVDEAKAAANAAKQTLTSLGSRKAPKPEVAKAQEKANALAVKVDKAQADAKTAEVRAAKAGATANAAMEKANAAAKADGKPAPFKLLSQVNTGFDTPARRANDSANAGQAGAMLAAKAGLEADQAYAKLAAQPGSGPLLQKMGVIDGASLQKLGLRLDREAMGLPARASDSSLDKLAKGADPKVFGSILQAAGSTVDGPNKAALSNPACAAAVAAGKAPKTALAAAPLEAKLEQGLAKLGLSQADFEAAAAEAKPALLKAAQAAAASDWSGAIDALGGAGKTAGLALASRAIQEAAKHLPEGVAKTLLTDPKLVDAMVKDPAVRATVGKLFDPAKRAEGLRELIGNDALRDTVLSRAGQDAGVKADLAKLGLTPKDLTDAGKAAPFLWDAVALASQGQVKEALATLQKGLEAAPELAEKLAEKFVDKLPPSLVQKFSELGITQEDLKKSGKALPKVFAAVDAAVNGDAPAALKALRDAALSASPITQKVLAKLAQKLPEGVAKTVLEDPAVLKQLSSNKKLYDSLGKLFDDQTRTQGVRELLGNDKARDAVLGALGKDPVVVADLAKLGLTPKDLKDAGKAAPHLWDAVDAASRGDLKTALTELQHGVEAAPALAQKLGEKLVDKLPPSLVKKFTDLGITQDDLKASAAALPKLFDAVQQFSDEDYQGAFDSMRDAAILGGPVTEKLVGKLAANLPDGLAKSVLSDPEVIHELVQSKEAQDTVGKLFDGRTRAGALRDLLGMDSLRDAALAAAGKDADVQKRLAAAGLTTDDLKQAGAAAPHLWDAADQLSKGHYTEGLKELSAAVQAAPQLAAKLADKVIDKLPPELVQKFASLGITQEDLKASAGALPKLFDAVQQFADKDYQGAFDSLRDAAIEGGPVTEKLLGKAAAKLPEGLAKSVLADPKVIHEFVTSKDAQDSIAKLFGAKTRLEGLRELLGDDSLRDAALEAAGQDPEVSKRLAAAGLTADDLKQAGAAAPHLWDAVDELAKGNFREGLQELGAAVQAAPQLAEKLAGKVLDKLPQELKDRFASLGITAEDLKASTAALPDLLNIVDKLTDHPPDLRGALVALRDAAFDAPAITQKLLGKLAEQLPPGVAHSVLTDPAVLTELTTNKALWASVGKLLDSDTRLDGVNELIRNDSARDAVLGALGDDPGVAEGLAKLGLDAADLVQAGRAAPNLLDAMKAAQSGDWQTAVREMAEVGKSAPDLVAKIGAAIYERLPPNVRTALENLGVTSENIQEAGEALPHVLAAAEKFATGKPQEALVELGRALEDAPDLVATMVSKAAARLPDGPVKSILSDKALFETLIKDEKLHGALRGLLSGTPEGVRDGLRQLSADKETVGAVAQALWSDPKLSGALEKLGFVSAKDLADAGGALNDVLALKDSLDRGDWKGVVEGLGQLVTDLPEGLKRMVADKVAVALHLPPGLADVIIQGGEALTDPTIRKDLAQAVDAFKRGDVGGFVKALAQTGEALTVQFPDAAVGFLNLMGKLPGSVGRFFGNPELNEALVKSGTVTHVFGAVEKIAAGDIGGALAELGNAAGDLIGYGDKFNVNIPFKGGVELPVGEKGLKAMAQLFGQFVEALPAKVKAKIVSAVASLTAKAGASIIPGGSLLGLIGDVPGLVGAIRADPKDALEIALKAAKVGVDVAGVIPGAAAITGPLGVAIGVIDFVHSAKDLIDDVEEFKKAFAFGP
jgi:hypothetical protein